LTVLHGDQVVSVTNAMSVPDQLLTNLPNTPINQLPDWLPDQWKPRNPAQSG